MEKHVFAVGPKNAQIMLVGEAPGIEEQRTRVPFVGGSGRILNYMLSDAGIDRAECRIDNVVNIRPPGNNFGVFYADKARKHPLPILLEHRERLYKEIASVKPNVIVALGAEALKALTDRNYIGKWRGSILSTPHGKVVPTLHPANIMRQWSARPIAVFDLERAKKESISPKVLFEVRYFITSPTEGEVEKELLELGSSPYISFDIETTRGWPKHITCIGFADSKEHAICIPFVDKNGSHYWKDALTEARIWKMIGKLLGNDSKKIAQNAQFDISLLSYQGLYVNNFWFDTMIGQHVVYPELPKGLAFLCSIYTKQPFYKDMVRTNLWKYNCLDACVTYEVAFEILKELKEFGTEKFYFRYAHPMVEPLIDIQQKGMKVDLAMRSELSKDLRAKITKDQELLDKVVGHPLNVASNKQMQAFLYGELGLEPRYNRKTSKITADEEALLYLMRKHGLKVLKVVLSIRGDTKMASTWIEAGLGDGDRLRTSYLIDGTRSGRLSSKKYIDEMGTDLQNVPKGPARRMIIAEEGNIFVSGDLKQAEARVVAYLANEEHQIEAFESGEDPFMQFASLIFRKPLAEVQPGERNVAKRLNHAYNYGISAKGLAAELGISISDAKEFLIEQGNSFPNINAWKISIEGQLRRTKILSTPFGRKRMFFGRINNETLREAYSYIPQSVVADIIDTALVNLYWTLPKGERIALQVHDNLVVECKERQSGMVTEMMRNAMEFPVEINNRELVIPTEFTYGKSWDELG